MSPLANTAAALTSAFEKTPTRLTRCAHSSYAGLIKLIPTGYTGGWSGGAKVLGKLSVPGRPTSLDDSRARAYCACSRCG